MAINLIDITSNGSTVDVRYTINPEPTSTVYIDITYAGDTTSTPVTYSSLYCISTRLLVKNRSYTIKVRSGDQVSNSITYTADYKLKKPSSVLLTPVANNALLAQCDKIRDTEYYNFAIYSNSACTNLVKLITVLQSDTPYTRFDSLTEGTTYYLQCQAVSGDETYGDSSVSTTIYNQTLSSLDVNQLNSTDYYDFSLQTNTATGDNSDISNSIIAQTAKSYTITDLVDDTDYYLRIRSQNDIEGHLDSELSNILSTSTMEKIQLDIPRLDIILDECNNLSYLISHDNVPDNLLISYVVYRGTEVVDGEITNAVVFTTNMTGLHSIINSWNDQSLDPYHTYYFQIKAMVDPNDAYTSSELSPITIQIPNNVLRRPFNVNIVQAGVESRNIIVYFSEDTNADYTTIQVAYDCNFEDLIITYEKTHTGAIVYDLTPDRVYYIRLKSTSKTVVLDDSCWTNCEYQHGNVILVKNIDDSVQIEHSLRWCLNKINSIRDAGNISNYSIMFSHTLQGETLEIGNAINVNQFVTIDASSIGGITCQPIELEADSYQLTQIFLVRHRNGDVIFNSFNIKHGYGNTGGGVYCNTQSGVLFINCTFSQNLLINTVPSCNIWNMDSIEGGALYFTGQGTLTLQDCEFFNNNSTFSGGALSVISRTDNIDVNIINCSFHNNNSYVLGGAITFRTSSGCTLHTNITSTDIKDNTTGDELGSCTTYGGGICALGDVRLNMIDNRDTLTRFKSIGVVNNIANMGGGIYSAINEVRSGNAYAPIHMVNYSVSQNNATGLYFTEYGEPDISQPTSSDKIADGSEIYSTINSCIFYDNSQHGIFITNNHERSNNLSKHIFYNNGTSVVSSIYDCANVVINNTVISGNREYGICNEGLLVVSETTSSITPSDYSPEGDIINELDENDSKINVFITNCELYQNQNCGIYLALNDDMISTGGGSLATQINAYIYNTSAYENYNSGISCVNSTEIYTFKNSINYDSVYGINQSKLNLYMDGTTADCNECSGLYFNNEGTSLISSRNKQNTEANMSEISFITDNCEIANNNYVGVYSISDGMQNNMQIVNDGDINDQRVVNGTLNNTDIINNRSIISYGGGIYRRGYGTFTFNRCLISNNGISQEEPVYIPYCGGGIYDISHGDLIINQSIITGNNASDNGGGIYRSGGGNTYIEDSVISANTSCTYSQYTDGMTPEEIANLDSYTRGYGGGIYYRVELKNMDDTVSFNVVNSSISGNNSILGRGIYTTKSNIYTNINSYAAINNSFIAYNNDENDTGNITSPNYISVVTPYEAVIQGTDNVKDIVDNCIMKFKNGVTDYTDMVTTNTGQIYFVNYSVLEQSDPETDKTILTDYTNSNIYSIQTKLDADPAATVVVSKPIFADDVISNIYTFNLIPQGKHSILFNKGRNSLAIDSNGLPLELDVRGNARFIGVVDIGAYEYGESLAKPENIVAEVRQAEINGAVVNTVEVTCDDVPYATHYRAKTTPFGIPENITYYPVNENGESKPITAVGDFIAQQYYDVYIQATAFETVGDFDTLGNSPWSDPVTVYIQPQLGPPTVDTAPIIGDNGVVMYNAIAVDITNLDTNATNCIVEFSPSPSFVEDSTQSETFSISRNTEEESDVMHVQLLNNVNPNGINITYFVRAKFTNSFGNYISSSWSNTSSISLTAYSNPLEFVTELNATKEELENKQFSYFDVDAYFNDETSSSSGSSSSSGVVQSASIFLYWHTSSAVENIQYSVYRTRTPQNDSSWDRIAEGLTETKYQDTSFSLNTTYYYRVCVGSISPNDTDNMMVSDTLTVDTHLIKLSSEWIDSVLTLSWRKLSLQNQNKQIYKIYKAGEDGIFTLLLTTTADTTTGTVLTYQDTNYVSGIVNYKVTVICDNVEQDSNIVQITRQPSTFYYILGNGATEQNFTNPVCWSDDSTGLTVTSKTPQIYDNFVIDISAATLTATLKISTEEFAERLIVNSGANLITLSSTVSKVILRNLDITGTLILSGNTEWLFGKYRSSFLTMKPFYGTDGEITGDSYIDLQNGSMLGTFPDTLNPNYTSVFTSLHETSHVKSYMVGRSEIFGSYNLPTNIENLYISLHNGDFIDITSDIVCGSVILTNMETRQIYVNFTISGSLTLYKDCIVSTSANVADNYGIILNTGGDININLVSDESQRESIIDFRAITYSSSLYPQTETLVNNYFNINCVRPTGNVTMYNVVTTIKGYLGTDQLNNSSVQAYVSENNSNGVHQLKFDSKTVLTLSDDLFVEYMNGSGGVKLNNHLLRLYWANIGGVTGPGVLGYTWLEAGHYTIAGITDCTQRDYTPTPPQLFIQEKTTVPGTYELKWTSAEGASSYRIEMSTDLENWSTLVANTSGNQYDLGNFTELTYYRIAIANIRTNSEFYFYSNTVTRYNWTLPTTLSATPTGLTSVMLEWDMNPNIPYYQVSRATGENPNSNSFTVLGNYDTETRIFTPITE